MKTLFICLLSTLLFTQWPGQVRLLAADPATTGYPFEIQFEAGASEFAPGDRITIQKVRGTSGTIKAGESYCVEGTYTLASIPEAELAFFATSQNTNPVQTESKQTTIVKQGSGTFRLEKTMTADGYLHVSFYPAKGGNSFGGVYFGQGKWVMKSKGFSKPLESASSNVDPGATAGSFAVPLAPANQKIFEFLGEPVAPPSDIDPRYTQAGLTQAVTAAAQKAGITLKKITIDDSEFPFLVGINCVNGDFPKLEEQLKKTEGYEYKGSVGWATCYAINIVPWAVSPPGTGQRVSHRSTLRESMLYERIMHLQ